MTILTKPLRLLQRTSSLKNPNVPFLNFAQGKNSFCPAKSNLCSKRTAITRKAYSAGSDLLKTKFIKTSTSFRGLNLSFKRRNDILPCFALDKGREPSLPSKEKEIRVGQEGPSIWIVNKVETVTKKLIHDTCHGFTRPLSDNFQDLVYNKQKELKLASFGRRLQYRVEKQFSRFELRFRKGCQLFTIYVFGSFCWLYLIRYSSGTSQFTLSNSFLFQDVFLENLPLLSENKILSGEISEKSLLTPLLENSPTSLEKIKNSFTNRKFQCIELTSAFSEKLENFQSQKTENFKEVFSNSDILTFFARKPIFLKNFSPTSKILGLSSWQVNKPLEKNQEVAEKTNYFKLLHNNKSSFIFFKKQRLAQKTVYAFSGTSIIIDREIDILPRKLEGLANLKKSRQSAFHPKEATHKSKIGRRFQKKNSLIDFQPFETSKKTGRILLATSQGPFSLPKNVLWCKTQLLKKQNWRENTILVQEPVKLLQEEQGLPVPVYKNDCYFAKNKNIKIVNDQIVFQKLLMQNSNEIDGQDNGQFLESFKTAPLESGFTFPNVPIIQKHKEKLKGGLGLRLSSKGSFLRKSITSRTRNIFLEKETTKKVNKNLLSKTTNVGASPLTFRFSSQKNVFQSKPFLQWLYNFNSQPIVYFSSKDLSLEEEKVVQFVFDKHSDFKTTNCILDQKVSLQDKQNTFIEKVFSYKRKSFNDAPENFFGTPYLKLGERFTIENLQGKTQMQTLGTLHGGDLDLIQKTPASPYASMGTSLNTMFGQKLLTKGKTLPNTNPKSAKARLVRKWAKEATVNNETLTKSGLNRELKDINNQKENSKVIVQAQKSPFSVAEEKKLENKDLTSEYNLFKNIYFRGIAGKFYLDKSLLFKYYEAPGTTHPQIQPGLHTLLEYKKSQLFPTIHYNYRLISTKDLPFKDLKKQDNTNMDIEAQSILGGVRQGIETQRRAHYLGKLTPENPINSSKNNTTIQGKSEEKDPDLIKKIDLKELKEKKRRLSNNYPVFPSLTVSPQKAFPQKALGSGDIVDYNLSCSFNVPILMSSTKNFKGSTQPQIFYFEKSSNFLSKLSFFAITWYSFKLLAKPFSKAIPLLPATFTEAIGLESFQEKFRIIKKYKIQQTLKDLAGAEKTLAQLRDLIWTFKLVDARKKNFFTLLPYRGNNKGKLRNSVFSKKQNRLLLVGPPGTGKTLLVKAIAAEAKLPVIAHSVSSLRIIAGVENPVSALFHVAKQIKPCIIFLDELDTLGNDYDLSRNNLTAEQQLSIRLARKYTYTLLLELDGLTSSTEDLLIIGATNRPETLNPALTRPGRFETIIDLNLPSQEVRTSLFSFYLSATQKSQQNLLFKIKKSFNFIKSKIFLKSIQKTKNPKLADNTLWLESYLASKCYGLSHASIGAIINHSALDSMLENGAKHKPLHSLETLDRAINSVKTLALRSPSWSFKNTAFLPAPSKGSKEKLKKKKNKLNHGKISSLKGHLRNSKERLNCSSVITSFEKECLVNRVYQIIGSLIFDKKRQEKTKHKKRLFYVQKEADSSIFLIHKTIKQEKTPISRKDYQSLLLGHYSGRACSSLYTTLKPQTLTILERSGLYQDPNYVASIVLTLKLLTDKVLTENLNSLVPKKSYKNNPLVRTSLTTRKKQQFISEKLIKNFFPYSSNSYSSGMQSTVLLEKSMAFWKNPKMFKKSFSSTATLIKQSKEVPQTLLIDLKAYNGSKTNWSRVYLSRPFFQYNDSHHIEHKEYFPKYSYFLEKNNLGQRSVATLSHTTLSPSFDWGHSNHLTFLSKRNPQEKGKLFSNCLSDNFYSAKQNSSNYKAETKDSLYLALVANIFHKGIKFFEKNRELTDYCAYSFLRYGMFYDLYQKEISQRF